MSGRGNYPTVSDSRVCDVLHHSAPMDSDKNGPKLQESCHVQWVILRRIFVSPLQLCRNPSCFDSTFCVFETIIISYYTQSWRDGSLALVMRHCRVGCNFKPFFFFKGKWKCDSCREIKCQKNRFKCRAMMLDFLCGFFFVRFMGVENRLMRSYFLFVFPTLPIMLMAIYNESLDGATVAHSFLPLIGPKKIFHRFELFTKNGRRRRSSAC